MDHNAIFEANAAVSFETKALEVFAFQYQNCPPYTRFCKLLRRDPSNVKSLEQLPFLPVELFKRHQLLAKNEKAELIFRSSGTTGQTPSTHYVADADLYKQSFTAGFELAYGPLKDYVILGLLPSYLERKDASLVYMVQDWIASSNSPVSGFYLSELDGLRSTIKKLEAKGQKYVLIGVSFALLDLAEMGPLPINHGIVMETGGMKGRRKELIRSALHKKLQKAFGPNPIHSEYGMTELLSQAYSKGQGLFQTPPWMKVLTRQPNDPFHYINGQTGGVSVIDLANLYSCSFIATQDLGKVFSDGSFEILGRFDQSDLRGCNLMVF